VLPRLGSMRVSEVSRRDVHDLHRQISRKYPIAANRVLALVSKMFSLAVLWEMRIDNPATRIPKNPENRRERFLSSAELAALGKALREASSDQGESAYAVAAIRLLLFTGCRRNEILSLKWDEVDFEHGVLRLPDSKTGRRVVQLNAPALEILANLHDSPQREQRCRLVIQGANRDKHQLSLQEPWARIRDSADLDGVRLHDLRHTHASVAAQRGESLIVIGSLLGHRAPATTARYAHLSDDPRRAASERTATDIETAMDADPVEFARTVPLRR
jgi:integrase